MSEVEDLVEEKGEKSRQPSIKNNSRECAAIINQYWFERGYNPQARTERMPGGWLTIKSNMINGFPTKVA